MMDDYKLTVFLLGLTAMLADELLGTARTIAGGRTSSRLDELERRARKLRSEVG